MPLEQEELTGRIIGAEHILDFFVEGSIVVELKAIKDIDDIHFSIARSYLRAVRRRHGLILNFAKTTLEVKRVLGTE